MRKAWNTIIPFRYHIWWSDPVGQALVWRLGCYILVGPWPLGWWPQANEKSKSHHVAVAPRPNRPGWCRDVARSLAETRMFPGCWSKRLQLSLMPCNILRCRMLIDWHEEVDKCIYRLGFLQNIVVLTLHSASDGNILMSRMFERQQILTRCKRPGCCQDDYY